LCLLACARSSTQSIAPRKKSFYIKTNKPTFYLLNIYCIRCNLENSNLDLGKEPALLREKGTRDQRPTVGKWYVRGHGVS
jgi:hypothetical protein